MLGQVGHTGFQCRQVFLAQLLFGHAAMHFKRSHGRDNDCRPRPQAGKTALDIQKLFSAQVSAKACFGYHYIRQFQRILRRHHAIAAMGDIGKRSAMYKGRRMLQRLDHVGFNGVFEQQSQRASHIELRRCHRLIIIRIAHNNPANARLHVLKIAGQA